MDARVVTFGEIMLRLSPPGRQRFPQAKSFEAVYGGGEANVAAGLAALGLRPEFVTRLPENDLGAACLQYLAQHGVDTRHVLRGGERLGIYFLEQGAAVRGSQVIYDRVGSSFATLKPSMLDWPAILEGVSWFHWTGITPAVSEAAASACLDGIRAARQLGLTVSCDLNFRAKLWKWGREAGEVMPGLVEGCDLAVANEEDTEKVFGIRAEGADVRRGRVEAEKYRPVCEQLAVRFPRLATVAITLRGSLSASHNTWGAVLWQKGRFFTSPTYDLEDIVDRVGAGDSFSAGLIYGMLRFPTDPQHVLDFAVAASALKHSIFGDFNLARVGEVEALLGGNASGRVER
jgi:2-dehydro-3-deoxygluconokinase